MQFPSAKAVSIGHTYVHALEWILDKQPEEKLERSRERVQVVTNQDYSIPLDKRWRGSMVPRPLLLFAVWKHGENLVQTQSQVSHVRILLL